MVIVDTNIIIDHLRSQSSTSVLIRLFDAYPEEPITTSVICLQELYEGESTRDDQKEQYLLSTLGSLDVLPYTVEIATLAGKLARDAKQSMEFADAAFAATALVNEAELFTLNQKHFTGILNLKLRTLPSKP
ncbi:PIN domain-containing protein [Candidatus Gottesmanbacteria bacterium]|nr:PIN domain-containing protein [Candidatus Gottesmanbacteria bacterium]